jgi:hypothetical protein
LSNHDLSKDGPVLWQQFRFRGESMFRALTLVAVLAGLATILSAQAIYPDTFKVNYFSNIGIANPAQVQMTNVGTSGGNICADIYVFNPSQELEECCSCQLTPDGLRTLTIGGVDGDIANNPVTGFDPPLLNGVIKIVSSSGTCSGSGLPLPVSPKPTPGLRAWGGHLNGPGVLTETPFLDAGLSAVELSRLGAQCNAIKMVGSGQGVCSCGVAPIG